jgi:DNA polymerase
MGGDLHYNWNEAAASALDWWVEAGVDTLVDDDVRDWLARLPRPAAAPADAAPVAEILPDSLESFVAWRLGEDAPEAGWHSPLLAPQGDAGAPLMVLLDVPEAEDGETGTLLSGPEGRLLDRMLAAIGHSRANVHLATVALARPLSGAIPRDAEPRLFELARHHVQLARPGQLLLMGKLAQRAFTGSDDTGEMGRLQHVNHEDGTMRVLTSLHPRGLLQRPASKAEAWKHLQLLIGGDEQ